MSQSDRIASFPELASDLAAACAEAGITFVGPRVELLRTLGDKTAARDLARWPTYMGTVVPGNRVGRTIGFPTANLEPPVARATPGDGVYAAWVERWPLGEHARFYLAAVSVGDRPTFAGTIRLVEAYLLDFDGDLYGETLRLHVVARIRGQERFSSVDALVAQMHRDVERCREILAGNPPSGIPK